MQLCIGAVWEGTRSVAVVAGSWRAGRHHRSGHLHGSRPQVCLIRSALTNAG